MGSTERIFVFGPRPYANAISHIRIIDYCHKNYKKYKNNFVKPNDFYVKKKNVSKKYDKQMPSKGKCFNCGKPGHCAGQTNRRIKIFRQIWGILKQFRIFNNIIFEAFWLLFKPVKQGNHLYQ